jgi:hypothetical protein
MDIAAAGADGTVCLTVGPVEAEKRGPRRVQQGFAALEAVVAADGAVKRLAANLNLLRLVCRSQIHTGSRYSLMASLMFANASSRLFPSLMQPGSEGTYAV